MLSLAFGKMGLTWRDLYDFTWQDFSYAWKGYIDKESHKEKQETVRLRMLGWIVYCGYADPKTSPSNIDAWWPLEGKAIKKASRKTVRNWLKKFEGKI